jgi:hypothetical protein
VDGPVLKATERTAVSDDVIAYIDGFNLYNGLRDQYRKRFLWLDLQRLCERLLLGDQRLVSVKYFTAPVRDRPRASADSRRSGTHSVSGATGSRSISVASSARP